MQAFIVKFKVMLVSDHKLVVTPFTSDIYCGGFNNKIILLPNSNSINVRDFVVNLKREVCLRTREISYHSSSTVVKSRSLVIVR